MAGQAKNWFSISAESSTYYIRWVVRLKKILSADCLYGQGDLDRNCTTDQRLPQHEW